MLKTQKVYLPVLVKDRMPTKKGYYTILCTDKTSSHERTAYYQENDFYWGETRNLLITNATHWLEEKEMIVLTQEQHDKLFLTAVEWGFRSGEKGNNLEKTMIDFKKLMTDK